MSPKQVSGLKRVKELTLIKKEITSDTSRGASLKRKTKIAADNIFIFYFYLSRKIRLDFPCESSA